MFAVDCEALRKASESVIPLSTNDDPHFSQALPRSKSAEWSLDDGGQVTRRPTTPITYTNLLNWRRGKPEVYVINDTDHVTGSARRSSTGSKRSSGHERGGKMASDETLTSLDRSSTAAGQFFVFYFRFYRATLCVSAVIAVERWLSAVCHTPVLCLNG